MTAELVRGQNHVLPQTRLEIRVSAGRPVVAGATLSDEHGKVRGADWVAHPASPGMPGLEVSKQAAADHRLAVDLGALPPGAERVSILLALPFADGAPAAGAGEDPARFGALAAPFVAVTGLDGSEIASYTITDLDAESAVVALELYRRQGAWKVRAVGQGYAGGLAAMLTDQGLSDGPSLATEILDAVARGMARSVAAPPQRTTEADRLRHSAQAAQPAAQEAHSAAAAPSANSARPAATFAPEGHVAQPPSPTSADDGTAPQPPATAPSPEAPAPLAPESQDDPHGQDGLPSQGAPRGQGDRHISHDQDRHDQDRHDQDRLGQPHHPDPQPDRPESQSAAPASTGGPVDYTHPARRAAAPPAAAAAPVAQPAQPGQPAQPVAGDATGWSMEERLYNQVWGMFEDLARTVAAFRSAVDFAESRMEQELDQVLTDPRSRISGQGDAARAAARAKQAKLVEQAREVLDRDLAQLAAEAEVVEPALPPSFASWDNPVWHAYRVPMEPPMALRLGDLRLPESAELRIPMLIRLPLERGLWIDSGRTASSATGSFADGDDLRRLAVDTAVAHAARLLAVYPPGDFAVHVIDPAGAAAGPLTPLRDAGVLAEPPAAGAAGVSEVLARLTRRVDLVQMAVRARATDSLPPDVDTAEQLLIVNDFPHGFDDRAVTQLRYLADEGPAVGVHLMMVADREDAAEYGPVLDPLWRSLLRLTPVPDDHLADPWVGHAWTYEPSLTPPGSQVLGDVLARVADARRAWGR
ncbi:TerD family protein [Streptomyces sp. B-S-A8]|uniref:TerD family protein n=1 Tax=Streptomyces solicavernae TaxID=3043614 RepID=A0ABT6RSE4_9ACTN|nr:TerD family protein [Streptomyces sp. B-S-A8]MDI3387366.1 TerD family protein [Streptomyces sp. B-S-A8]